jgi:hypothetical protein
VRLGGAENGLQTLQLKPQATRAQPAPLLEMEFQLPPKKCPLTSRPVQTFPKLNWKHFELLGVEPVEFLDLQNLGTFLNVVPHTKKLDVLDRI